MDVLQCVGTACGVKVAQCFWRLHFSSVFLKLLCGPGFPVILLPNFIAGFDFPWRNPGCVKDKGTARPFSAWPESVLVVGLWEGWDRDVLPCLEV